MLISRFRYTHLTCIILGKPIRGLPEEVVIDPKDSVAGLYKKIAASSKSSIHRLKITKGSDSSAIPISGVLIIEQTGLRNKSTIDVKDLGV